MVDLFVNTTCTNGPTLKIDEETVVHYVLTGPVTSAVDSRRARDHPKIESRDFSSMESKATDIHRSDYRCYIIPGIKSDETITEKLKHGKVAEVVPE